MDLCLHISTFLSGCSNIASIGHGSPREGSRWRRHPRQVAFSCVFKLVFTGLENGDFGLKTAIPGPENEIPRAECFCRPRANQIIELAGRWDLQAKRGRWSKNRIVWVLLTQISMPSYANILCALYCNRRSLM